MAKYPVRMNMPKVRSVKEYRDAPPTTQRDLDRHARMQGEEAKESKTVKKAAGGLAKQMPTSNGMGNLGMAKGGGIEKKGKTKTKMAGGGKCYAKGGSIDGIASRGKTRCKGAK